MCITKKHTETNYLDPYSNPQDSNVIPNTLCWLDQTHRITVHKYHIYYPPTTNQMEVKLKDE